MTAAVHLNSRVQRQSLEITREWLDMTTTHDKSVQLRKTRIVCISDTHNQTPKLPKGDVLIHAGDLTKQGSYSELRRTVDWLEKADFEAKIVIAGMPYSRSFQGRARMTGVQETTTSRSTHHSTSSMARHGGGQNHRIRRNAESSLSIHHPLPTSSMRQHPFT